MSIKAVLFDLDGTLLPMDQEVFVKAYLKLLAAKLSPLGYEPKKLVECIWTGVGAMVRNDGSCFNEKRFWDVFQAMYSKEAMDEHKPVIDRFYSEEFNAAQAACGFNPLSRRIIDQVKSTGRMAVLATNPVFPAAATENRIRWAGLSPEDFALYTTYENSSFCKPDPRYYEELLGKLGLVPAECVMVGNDAEEDMVAETLGMKVFLLTDCLICRNEKKLSAYPQGGFDRLEEFLAAL